MSTGNVNNNGNSGLFKRMSASVHSAAASAASAVNSNASSAAASAKKQKPNSVFSAGQASSSSTTSAKKKPVAQNQPATHKKPVEQKKSTGQNQPVTQKKSDTGSTVNENNNSTGILSKAKNLISSGLESAQAKVRDITSDSQNQSSETKKSETSVLKRYEGLIRDTYRKINEQEAANDANYNKKKGEFTFKDHQYTVTTPKTGKNGKITQFSAVSSDGKRINITAHESMSSENIYKLISSDGRTVYVDASDKNNLSFLDSKQAKAFAKKEAKMVSDVLIEQKSLQGKMKKSAAFSTLSQNMEVLPETKMKDVIGSITPDMMAEVNANLRSQGYDVSQSKDNITPLENFMIENLDAKDATKSFKRLCDKGCYGQEGSDTKNSAVGRFAGNIIYEGASGAGTNSNTINSGLSLLTNPEQMEAVNNVLEAKGYERKDNSTPLESLIDDEFGTKERCGTIKSMLDNGLYGEVGSKTHTEAMVRNATREIEHEVSGYTSTADLKSAISLIDESPEALSKVNENIHANHPKLKPDEGSYLRALIKDDGWSNEEVDRFDAVLIANNSYTSATVDEAGNVIEGDQAHRNEVLNRLLFTYTDEAIQTRKENSNNILDIAPEVLDSDDRESIRIALNAMQVPGPDYDNFLAEAAKYNEKRGFKPEFKGQSADQVYFVGNLFDAEGVDANNTLMYKGSQPPRVVAESALRKMRDGEYSDAFNSMDPKVYDEMSNMLANGEIKGVGDLEQVYKKAIEGEDNYEAVTRIKAGALLSGKIPMDDEEKVDICRSLMQVAYNNQLTPEKMFTDKTIFSYGSMENDANDAIATLGVILRQDAGLQQKLVQNLQKNPVLKGFDSKAIDNFVSSISDVDYGGVSEQVFLDENGQKIADPTKIKEMSDANMAKLGPLREYVAHLERDHKMTLDEEGIFSDIADSLSVNFGGKDRRDVARDYLVAKGFLKELELAGQGKLRDKQGKVISMDELLSKRANEMVNVLRESNADYEESQAKMKTIVALAPVILATAIGTGGASTALGAAVVAGTTTLTLEGTYQALELATSKTGNTTENRAAAVKDVVTDATFSAATAGVVKYGTSKILKPGVDPTTKRKLAAYTYQESVNQVSSFAANPEGYNLDASQIGLNMLQKKAKFKTPAKFASFFKKAYDNFS